MADPTSTTGGQPLLLLSTPPGILNDVLSDDIDQMTIDFDSEGAFSVMNRAIVSTFTKNSLRDTGPLMGILLQEEEPPADNEASAGWENMFDKAMEALGVTSPKLKKFRVRVPELHFAIPIPSKLDSPDPVSQQAISMHPLFQAVNVATGDEPVVPGDLVMIDIGSKGNMSNLVYLGPIKTDSATAGATSAGAAGQFGSCGPQLETSAASGDQVGGGATFPAGHSGGNIVPVITAGQGHGKIEFIAGPNAKERFATRIKEIQDKKTYGLQGIIYLNKFEGLGGDADNVAMLNEIPGRQATIFMPATCNASQDFELIYYFHGIKGFKIGGFDWYGVVGPQAKAMSRAGRNFAIVNVENLWSIQGANKEDGIPRQKTSRGASGWTDRTWGAWGYQPGVNSIWPPNGQQPLDYVSPFHKTPGYPNPQAAGGDFSVFHGEILAALKEHFGFTKDRPAVITMIGHSAGGATIGMAAKTGQLQKVKPDKIQFSDSSYGGHSDNGYLDSDIFDTFRLYVKDNPNVVLEMHSCYLPHRPKYMGESKPSWAGQAMVGITREIVAKEGNAGKSYAELSAQIIARADEFIQYAPAGATSKPSIDAAKKEAATNIRKAGRRFINPSKREDNFFRLPAPFSNIIHMSWWSKYHATLSRQTIKWTPSDVAASPVPVPAGTATHKVYNTAGDTSDPFLNLRDAAASSGTKLAKMPDGTGLTVVSKNHGSNNKWWKIKIVSDGGAQFLTTPQKKEGYASSDYITTMGASPTVTATATVTPPAAPTSPTTPADPPSAEQTEQNQTPPTPPVAPAAECQASGHASATGEEPPGTAGPNGPPFPKSTRNSPLGSRPRAESVELAPGCTEAQYKAHMRAQSSKMLILMAGQPSLSSKAGSHQGVKNIIVGGEPKACPFKVIRYDGTVPGFERRVNIGGAGLGKSKGWWDPSSDAARASKQRFALRPTSRSFRGSGPYYRKPEKITHFTIHHGGSGDTTFKPGHGLLAQFQLTGFMGHFCVDKNGQIYQVTDPLCRTSHCQGASLSTSTNNISVAIDYLQGVHVAKQQPRPTPDDMITFADTAANKINVRKYNMGASGWNTVSQISVNTSAAHEATYKLIKWLEGYTAIKHKYCYIDGRIDKAIMLKSSVQAHHQLQDNRRDGMAYIFWAASQNKSGRVSVDW